MQSLTRVRPVFPTIDKSINKIYDPRIILKKEMYLKVPTINVP